MTTCRPADPTAIAAAVDRLAAGELAILPTDTVYGIAADIRHAEAVAAIAVAKGRAPDLPLQLLFTPDSAMVARYASLTDHASRLIEAFGPGGWTLIVPAAEGWDSPALAGGRTVGIRIPAAPVLQEVVRELRAPVAASSANRHGGPSPLTCAEAVAQVGEACAIALDGGPCAARLDSTVIDCAGEEPHILREGAIDRETVARILGLDSIPVLRSVRS